MKESHGFSLLEILIVCAVAGLCAALALPAIAAGRMNANRAKCASNMRQIGLALHLYANDNNGNFPPTTHSTGSRRVEESWIYGVADYLDKIDEVRVCPADPPARRKMILERKATSYALNELVFDEEHYHRIQNIPFPARTLFAVILSENRTPAATWDHVHSGEWTSWLKMLNDTQADRHLVGSRPTAAAQRTKGSANYLYADGHVENITASQMKKILDAGDNPAAVPTLP